ncbi:hypothetical protein Pan97_30200 [Bremerella volcania]|uniref:Uncharacterized protein n=1 Tax=Bremerella volcania TaxID=2527984 RepID=A0A518C9R9_9BACT|nr:hypothetical protein [Bremerella volcania]QDU75976.1 hypothetical protein Pan97_30200 [Bremerella volcania]
MPEGNSLRFLAVYEHAFPRLLELIDQGYTQAEAARVLNDEGIRTSTGAPLNQPTVCRMLKFARQRQRAQQVVAVESPGKTWDDLNMVERYQRIEAIEQAPRIDDSDFVARELNKQLEEQAQAIRYATSGKFIG